MIFFFSKALKIVLIAFLYSMVRPKTKQTYKEIAQLVLERFRGQTGLACTPDHWSLSVALSLAFSASI